MNILTVDAMGAMDKKAMNLYKIPELILMENAALAAYHTMKSWLKKKNQGIMVFCGSGNNGGDGIALARKLHSTGHRVIVVLLSSPEKFGEAAGVHYQALKTMKVTILDFQTVADLEVKLAHSSIIVDAMLGTGLDRPVSGHYGRAIKMINNSGKKIISLDIPSGVSGDTGRIMGFAVKAQKTISFGLPKRGNLLYPGFEQGGSLYVSHISFPPELYKTPATTINLKINKPRPLPPRPENGHKGSLGKALFIAGSPAYLGAPYFTAHSFMKAGGGYSRLAAANEVTRHVSHLAPETVLCPQETTEGYLSEKNLTSLLELAELCDIVVIGPGLGLAEPTQKLTQAIIKHCPKPLIIDGDGLTALSREMRILKQRKAPTLLTPHLGEMKRLLPLPEKKPEYSGLAHFHIEEIDNFCRTNKVHLILKGAHSLIATPDKNIALNLSGNSAMATAGSGDVLSGLTAALYCRYQDLSQAAQAACFIHGLAGDLAAGKIGPDGVTAQEILKQISQAMLVYSEKRKKVLASYLPKII